MCHEFSLQLLKEVNALKLEREVPNLSYLAKRSWEGSIEMGIGRLLDIHEDLVALKIFYGVRGPIVRSSWGMLNRLGFNSSWTW